MCDLISTQTRSNAISIALARATLARLIAELFAEQDLTGYARLGADEVHRETALAAKTLSIASKLVDQIFRDRPSFENYLESRSQLLGHTVRSNCPPYELEYTQAEIFQQSQRLADVAGFYSAFGFETAGSLAERPDHVVPEWEFLSILAAKEAYALQTGSSEGVTCCSNAQRVFLTEHAAFWMFAFFERMRRAGGEGFFTRAAEFASAVLREWCRTYDVATGPNWLELRSFSEEDSTIECGAPGSASVELGPRLAAAMEASIAK